MNPRIKWILITVSACLAIGVTASLGRWQLSRAAEKQALQAVVEAQSAKPLLNADDLRNSSDIAPFLHQRARVRGFWVKDATIFLENRPMNGRVGFIVLTPLVMYSGGKTIVVQRGWVPRDFQDRGRVPYVETPVGMVEIEGRMALPPSKLYEPGVSSVGAIRQNVNMALYQAETGLQLMPLTLQQTGEASAGLLRDWQAVNLGMERNRGYALQWFGLSGLVVVLYLWFQVIRRFFYRPQDTHHHV